MERDWTPHINWLEPETEREAAHHISTQLLMLQFHENQFASAVSLFDHCETLIEAKRADDPESRRLGERAAIANWMNIAANHAALTVYHFQSTLRSIRDQLQYAPTLARKVDRKALEEAFNRFAQEFPAWKHIRDWVGHFSDKLFKPADIEEHRGGEGPFIHGSLNGRSLVFTRKGKFIHLNVTEENRQRLRAVKRDSYAAFRKASAWPPPD